MSRATRGLLVLAAAVVVAGAGTALAEEGPELPIDVDVPQSLVVGKGQPYLTLTARDPVRGVTVTVKRSGAPARRFQVKALGAGGSRTFQWRERPGVYDYGVTVKASHGDWTSKQAFTFRLAYLPPIEVRLSRDRVDLAKRHLTFQMNHPAERAELVVKGPGGRVLARVEESYGGADPGSSLGISWPEVREPITCIDLTAHSTAGFWAGMALEPWSVSIPHEEVEFETDRWEIRPSEAPKLDAAIELIHKALAEHGSELQVSLYVGGFTDTVGSKAHNRELSDHRAKAIAQYFSKHAVRVPIYYRGFGEEALAVGTPDETAEARNRRAAYVLGTQPPTLAKVRWGGWRRL